MTPTTPPPASEPMEAAREAWLASTDLICRDYDMVEWQVTKDKLAERAFDAGWKAAMAHRDAEDAQDNPHVDDLGHGVFG